MSTDELILEVSGVSLPLDAGLSGSHGHACMREACATALCVPPSAIKQLRLLRRSVDARRKNDVHFVAKLAVALDAAVFSSLEDIHPQAGISLRSYEETRPLHIPDCRAVARKGEYLRPVLVGAGPAGLFAALYLAEAGLCPVVLERGASVEKRIRVLESFVAGGTLDPQTNVVFGEGGAGAFSDGKLTTGTKDPHIRHVLEAFVQAGAPEEILWQAKPHIGTDRLPAVVKRLRRRIEAAGGSFCFETQLVGMRVAGGCVQAALVRSAGESAVRELTTDAIICACGHSARDTFALLREEGVAMERKPFAVGVRIEHEQAWLNRAQYGRFADHPALGAADYKLAVHLPRAHEPALAALDGRGVYTFCMCPGGSVVAAASEAGGVCTNGMSSFARDGNNCNSALLVEVRPDDLVGSDVFAGIELQQQMERKAFECAFQQTGRAFSAPVQTIGSFLGATTPQAANVHRCTSLVPSYPRGVAPFELREVLPGWICHALAEALPLLDRKLPGFAAPDAIMTAPETRSSSPVRMLRDPCTLQSISVSGLYPCGEGAGYAGGIMSAACDGIRVARALVDQKAPFAGEAIV